MRVRTASRLLLGVSVALNACATASSSPIGARAGAPFVASAPATSIASAATPASASASAYASDGGAGTLPAESTAPTVPTVPTEWMAETPPAPPSADALPAEAAFRTLDREIAAKYDTPERHTYRSVARAFGVADIDPVTKQVVRGVDGRLKMRVAAKFTENAAEAEKWDLRLQALIKKYESPEWVAAAMERQGNIFDTLRTALANANPVLFEGDEARELDKMRASGRPQLHVMAARIEASALEFWEKKRKQELDGADIVVVRRYATMVAFARAKGIRNERVTRALRRLAFYTDLIDDDTLASIVTSTPNPNDFGATKLTYRKRQYAPSP